MKQYLKFIITIALLTVLIFEGITIGILKFPENVFHSTYCSLIQDKYRILIETNEPKIIVVSGSSSAFGLDQTMLEEATGYKVVNLGLHAGFGHLFYSELAKANINKGDIVLLGYEYGWQDGFDSLDQKLIMTGIDSDIQMYTRIPVRKWKNFIGYLFAFAEIKNSYEGKESGIYSREAFDSKTGQMTMERDYIMEYSEEKYGTEDVTDAIITDQAKKYLLDFKVYVEEKEANVYFISPPLVADCVICDYSEFDKLKQLEEDEIGIPYISNPTDYFFPCELMSNARYHCNSKGEKVRTELLIEDLRRALVIE